MNRISNYFMIGLVIVFIGINIMTIPYSFYILPFFTIAVLLVSLYFSRGLAKIFGIIMVMLGTFILSFQNVPIEVWFEAITKNVALVSLISIVPILSIPIHLGQYDVKLAQFASRYNEKPQRLFTFLSGAFMILGPITNLGAIHILQSMLKRLNLPNSFLARSYVRGFTSINTWAPYFMSVFLVVYSLKIPMSTFLPYGLLLSVLQIVIANILFSMKEVKTIKFDKMESVQVENPWKLIELLVVIIGLTGIIFFFEQRVSMNISALIIISVVLFAFVWSLYLKQPYAMLKQTNSFRKSILPSGANEVGLILTAGFFSIALSMTVLSTYINAVWSSIADVSILLLIFATITLVALLSIIGVHQIVTISSIIASVSYTEIGMSDVTMAMTMLAAWAASTTLSPITPLNIVVSNLLKENVFKIIFKWNFWYSVIVMAVHTIAIYIIHLLIS